MVLMLNRGVFIIEFFEVTLLLGHNQGHKAHEAAHRSDHWHSGGICRGG
jgi:hypothetical protein